MTSVVLDILENITTPTWSALEQLRMVTDFAELHHEIHQVIYLMKEEEEERERKYVIH